jgi:flagella basal body P-ring formation protein FlgA
MASTALQAAEKTQSRTSIRETARQFIVSETTVAHESVPDIQVGRLDRRLRLTACSQSLHAFLPPGGRTLGNITVGVRCSGIKPWTVYVPVKVVAYKKVLVVTRPMKRGHVLLKNDLELATRDLSTLRSSYLTDSEQAVGKTLRRSISSGTMLSTSMLASPRIIRRGQAVTLVSRTGGLQVRATGKALMDGASGQRIRVQNKTSKKVVEGVVISAGVVQIPL